MTRIKHTILSWARETSKLSIKEAAHKLNLTDTKTMSAVEKLTVFEEGTKKIFRSLLLLMSKQYRQPLYYWFKKGWVKPKRDYRNFPVFTADDIKNIKKWQNTLK